MSSFYTLTDAPALRAALLNDYEMLTREQPMSLEAFSALIQGQSDQQIIDLANRALVSLGMSRKHPTTH